MPVRINARKLKLLRHWMQDKYDVPADRLAELYPASLGRMNEPMLSDEADTLLLRDSQRTPLNQDRFAALVKKYGVKPGERVWRGSYMGADDDLHTTASNAPSKIARWSMPSDSADAALGYVSQDKKHIPLLMQLDVDDSVRAIPGWHFGFNPASDLDPRYLDLNKAEGKVNELEWILPKGTFTESPWRTPLPPEVDLKYAREELDKRTLDRLINLRMKLKQKSRGGRITV